MLLVQLVREGPLDGRFRSDDDGGEALWSWTFRCWGGCCQAPALIGSRSLDDGGSVNLSTRDDHHGLATASEQRS